MDFFIVLNKKSSIVSYSILGLLPAFFNPTMFQGLSIQFDADNRKSDITTSEKRKIIECCDPEKKTFNVRVCYYHFFHSQEAKPSFTERDVPRENM